MKIYKLTIVTLLLFSALLQAQNKKANTPNLNGRWVSKQDPHYTLQIKNGWILESHSPAKQIDTFKYEITTTPCSTEKTKDKKNLYLRKSTWQGANLACYRLLSYSANAFAMLSADNKRYSFVRYLSHH